MSTAHGVIGPAPPEDWGEEAENDVHRESTTVTLPSVDLVDCHPFDIASRLIIEPSGKSARRLKLLSFGHPQKVINGADSPTTSHVNVSSKQLPADYGTDILFITPCMISKDSSDIPYAATLVARADRNDKPSIEELRSLVDKVLNGVTAPAHSAMQADSHGSLDGSALNAWNWTNKETSRLNYCRDSVAVNSSRYMSVLKSQFQADLPPDVKLAIEVINHDDMLALNDQGCCSIEPQKSSVREYEVFVRTREHGDDTATQPGKSAAVLISVAVNSESGVTVRSLLARPWETEHYDSISHNHRMAFKKGTKYDEELEKAWRTDLGKLLENERKSLADATQVSQDIATSQTQVTPSEEVGAGVDTESTPLLDSSIDSTSGMGHTDVRDFAVAIPQETDEQILSRLPLTQIESVITSAVRTYLESKTIKEREKAVPEIYLLKEAEFDDAVTSGVFTLPKSDSATGWPFLSSLRSRLGR